jgi:hypothetical protein
MYKWTGADADRAVIDAPEGTHAKEILLASLDGAPRPTLFAAVEARTELRNGSLVVVEPVRIKEYDFDGGSVSARVIATLNDRQCRFLSPGDVDGDGRTDLVAAAMDSGLWLLRRADDGSWTATLIDADSSGYEHAALAIDLEGDGHTDVYVASDRQHELRRYRWIDGRFDKQVILALPENEITFNLTAGRF